MTAATLDPPPQPRGRLEQIPKRPVNRFNSVTINHTSASVAEKITFSSPGREANFPDPESTNTTGAEKRGARLTRYRLPVSATQERNIVARDHERELLRFDPNSWHGQITS